MLVLLVMLLITCTPERHAINLDTPTAAAGYRLRRRAKSSRSVSRSNSRA
jgi:hypothetical protein